MQSRIDNLEKTFQSKTTLIEGNNDALKNELAALRQKELQQDQENKQLRDELTKLKVATEDSINNDLNYDSSDNDGDDNNDTNDVSVMEGNSYALPEELVALKQKEIEHQEENQGQKERLTRMEAGVEDDANNDLNYDSFDDGDDGDDDDNATGNVDIRKIYDDALQKELADLKQRELDHQKENQRLKERLAIMEAAMQNNADNDLNYDSSVNESDNENDINYDSEYSDSKEEEDDKDVENTQQPLPIYPNMDENHADPNYNSPDNEDPRNDIYYD
jgi:hypothetical protein